MLVNLLTPPKTAGDWEVFGFNNLTQLRAIRNAIQTQSGINLTEYITYPIDINRFGDWAYNNSQAHTDFNSVLNLQSSDLTSVNIKDEKQLRVWTYLNFFELQSASQVLGI